MKINTTLTGLATLSLTVAISSNLYAGWDDLLKKAEETGKELIEQQTGSDSAATGTTLDTDTLIKGLKEALEVGSRRAIEGISQSGGYLNNPDIRIPLPKGVDQAAGLMRQYGLGSQVDQFEQSMNQAAEKAAPQATEIIITALRGMTIEDAKRIFNGPDDAATQYFRDKTYSNLTALFRPSIKESMGQVGVTRYYNDLAGEAKQLPMVNQMVDLDLENHVTTKALDGLFAVLADEEARIRKDPAARTTDILKSVFGGS
ncbi:DUF4197 domain-containing protein [Marinobacterium jannaschii]|uniref:DUF4197 domain-containing protein n=1 Tax=Marinobacterium jannaschii TaxID=64970 RepID=UPI00048A3F16|nr:DUF4197 domain-containing protein [Marinobacterium jannaschii]